MNRINSQQQIQQHKRQSSNGSFTTLSNDPLQTSFSSLDNFLNATKLMEDEIMVPSKLREKKLATIHDEHEVNGVTTNGTTNGTPLTNGVNHKNGYTQNGATATDVLDYYKFIRFVRNQFLHSKPFNNIDDYHNNELKDKNFKKTFDELSYHYNGLMTILDHLSHDAKVITETYRESV